MLMYAPTRLLSRRRPSSTADLSSPSCRLSNCCKYLYPQSDGTPTQDIILSVGNQSMVSSDLSHKSMTLGSTRIEETYKTASGLRLSRKHCLIRCENRSVKSTSRVRAVAKAKLNQLYWTNHKTMDWENGESMIFDIQGQFLTVK